MRDTDDDTPPLGGWVSARELAEMERDRRAHERPNAPPRPNMPFTDCPESKYQTHRFSAINRAGEACCTFCGRRFQDCLVPA